MVAHQHKVKHDLQVKDTPLVEGQFMYLHNYGVKGHHNHDLWSHVVYQVVWLPHQDGVVYTITPVDNLSKVKTVNHSLLKSLIQRDSSGHVLAMSVAIVIPWEMSLQEEVDLVGVVPESCQASSGSAVGALVLPIQAEPQVLTRFSNPASRGSVILGSEVGVVGASFLPETVPLSANQSGQDEIPLRHTERTTAGCHLNPNHLPKSIRDVAPSSLMASSVTAIFRPWSWVLCCRISTHKQHI